MKSSTAKTRSALGLAAGTILTVGLAAGADAAEPKMSGPYVSVPASPHVSPALSSLPSSRGKSKTVTIRQRKNPRPDLTGWQQGDASSSGAADTTPVGRAGSRATPSPLITFEGQFNTCGCTPPDTNGDAGPSHYVQIVNATQIAVYDKTGTILAGYPKEMNTLWSGVGGNCSLSTDGDPNVLYDSLANRWLLAQFSTGNGICVAVSQTGDPTGAYNLYEFATPDFPDYFKFGVWPDAYYMSANEATYSAYAFDRAKMLAGQVATFIRFTGQTNLLLPADVDGKKAPPAGSPGLFYTFKDNSFHGGTDRIELFSFDADFVTPASSTFTLTSSFNIGSFTYTVCGFFVLNCIQQSGTVTKVDPVSEWPMFRFPYRNYGSYQALAGNFTIESSVVDKAAIRWFELRNTGSGWTLHQEGTVDSGDGISRWMGSIAFDAVGNLALGYSKSSSTMFPAIAYAVHRISDALGTMQPEVVMQAGGGSQTGSNRWGDYSSMSIDPGDDATFWFTSMYYPASASVAWHTRVGNFRILDTSAFNSVGANDGHIVETTETSGTGGAINATFAGLPVGDDAGNRQFRSILDFDTSAIPDTAIVTKAVLTVRQRGAITGSDPFATLGNIRLDIRNGAFNGNNALESADFQAAASLNNAGAINNNPRGDRFTALLGASALAHVNKTGHTQLRMRFLTDDNNNSTADFISFYSGDAPAVRQPVLTVTYYVP